MRGALTVGSFAVRESLRRRVFYVVLALTALYLVLYSVGAQKVFAEVGAFGDEDTRAFAGSTVFGLAMFGNLFLSSVLAVFLTNGVVRGDAETGMLQPLVVRPIGRRTMLFARFLAAGVTSVLYVVLVFLATLGITRALGDWSPDDPWVAVATLALGVLVLAAISVLASVFLSSTAQGIAVFMVFGAGLTAGLLGQIATVVGSDSLERIAEVIAWAFPFEALYQHGLHVISAESTRFGMGSLTLGPFGGSNEAAAAIWPWSTGYVVVVLALAMFAFARRDL